MSSKNQNKPPVNKNRPVCDAPMDKHRKIGTGRIMGSTTASRGRQALAPLNNQTNVAATQSETEVSESENIEFTKEEVNVLLNENFKGKKFDSKEYIEKLKICIKWFRKGLEDLEEEKDNLHTMLDSSARKRVETEAAMKIKEEELNSTISKLEKKISSLKESLANEESQKLNAIDSHNKEKEARMALEKNQNYLKEELLQAKQNALTADEEVKTQQNMNMILQEYNRGLQKYNIKLQDQLFTAIDANKQVEKEKAAILDDHITLKEHYLFMKQEFTSVNDSRDDAVKQKETAVKVADILIDEIKQLRVERECQVAELEKLSSQIIRYDESIERTAAEWERLSSNSIVLEKKCSAQTEQISELQHQLATANEKLKMADLSSSEKRREYENEQGIISELEGQLRKKEDQLREGERLKEKLHNAILELKGNISSNSCS